MVRSEQIDSQAIRDPVIVKEIRQLGWLSSFSRQVLLARHALRYLSFFSAEFESNNQALVRISGQSMDTDFLRLLRLLNDILCNDKLARGRVSAPYTPADRPLSFFLGEKRNGRLCSVSVLRPLKHPVLHGTAFSVDGPATTTNSNWFSYELEVPGGLALLAHEISTIRKGVTLSTKSLADGRCAELISEKLWAGRTLAPYSSNDIFLPFNSASEGAFKFWEEWYEGFLRGKPLDRSLLLAIAELPDTDWDKGAAHIARLIEKLRLKSQTDTTPRLVRSADSEVFEVENDAKLPDEVLAFVCNRIEDVLRTALLAGQNNGFHEGSEEAEALRAALGSPAKGASFLATSFFDACLSLNTNIGDRYPEVTSLINLKNALYAAVEEICEIDEPAKKRCARLAKLRNPEPVTLEDRALIAEAAEMAAPEVSDEAKAIIQSDVERILSTPTPPKSARARFANWMTTISIWLDRAQKVDKKAKWFSDLVSRMQKWWPPGGD